MKFIKWKQIKGKGVKEIWLWLKNNDITVKMYISFAFVLMLTEILTCIIFIRLYRENYVRSYTDLLTSQGRIIAKRVSSFENKGKINQFIRYSTYIDELEKAENTDIWIVSNENAVVPLAAEYTNAEAAEGLTPEMKEVIEKAYTGNVASNSSYDDAYGMVILRVAIPVYSKANRTVNGAVMMISMIDKQTMGIDKGTSIVVISLVLSFFISYIVSMWFSQFLSKPIAKIGRDISRISRENYASIRTKKPDTQLGRIEIMLNELAIKLGKAEKERANLEQVRRDFFANVSHELRTPITVIRGYAETLNDKVITDEKMIEDMYGKMLSECKGIERLVGDLFILSKMQNPDFEIEKEPVSLAQVFGDISRSALVIGQEKNIKFTLEMPEDNPCMVFGDYVRLRQMFMVIIDNAVKFSHEGGIVSVKVWGEHGKFNISIADTGVGISEEELPFIFEKFFKSKLKQNEKGTGLGLMIAKQIALKHEGEISVKSTKNVGTTFYFAFDECTSMEGFE